MGKAMENTPNPNRKQKRFRRLSKKGEKYENKELEEKARKAEKSRGAVKVIREFEDIIKSKSKNTIWSAYQQGKTFQRFKGK